MRSIRPIASIPLLVLSLAGSSADAAAPSGSLPPGVADRASVNGKYTDLIRTLDVPEDAETYGPFKDYGYWASGTYKGRSGLPPGYWVYLAPTWYIWSRVGDVRGSAPRPADEDRNRPNPHAPRPDPNLTGPFAAVYRYAGEHNLHLGDMRRLADLASGSLLPVTRTSDGGFLFTAYRDERTEADQHLVDRDGYRVYVTGKTFPVAVKLDATGRAQWDKTFEKRGCRDFEAGVSIETPQHQFIVSVRCYFHPGSGPAHRFLKLGASGEVLWDRQLRGRGGPGTPSVQTARLAKDGSIAL